MKSLTRFSKLSVLVAVLLVGVLHAGLAGATVTATPPYDDAGTATNDQPDATGQWTATANANANVDGTLSASVSAQGALPIPVHASVPYSGLVFGSDVRVGEVYPGAQAFIDHAIAISAADTYTLSAELTSLTASFSSSNGTLGCTYGIGSCAYPYSGADAYFAYYPCAVGGGCYGSTNVVDYKSYSPNYEPPSTETLTGTLTTSGGGHIGIRVRLYSVAQAWGDASGSASISGSLSQITLTP